MGCPVCVDGSRADFCGGRFCQVLILAVNAKRWVEGIMLFLVGQPVAVATVRPFGSLGLKRLLNFYCCKNVLNKRNVFASSVAKLGGDSTVGLSR
jgi:hypothetical protein